MRTFRYKLYTSSCTSGALPDDIDPDHINDHFSRKNAIGYFVSGVIRYVLTKEPASLRTTCFQSMNTLEHIGIMAHFASDICNGILPRHCYSLFNCHSWHLIQYFLLWFVQSLYFAKQYNFSVVDAVLLQLNHSKNKAKPMILSTTP